MNLLALRYARSIACKPVPIRMPAKCHSCIALSHAPTADCCHQKPFATRRLRVRNGRIGYVCPGYEGPRQRDWRHWFEDAVGAAQLSNFRWHDLRHTFASRLVMAGVPLRAVQVLMGHKRIETTLRYSYLGETELHKAVERLTVTATDTTTSTGQSDPENEQALASA